jgi:predicted nuclease of predicted toxin-antitoxin system
MRILANENFPGDAVAKLRQSGHDVAWVRTDAPGMSDQEVLKRAEDEDRVLITFDKDFGELAFRARLPASSGIVLFRVLAPSSAHVARVAVAALESRMD